ATAGDVTACVATEPIEEEETATAGDVTACVATEPIEEEEPATAGDATAYVATEPLIVERQQESTKVTHRDPRNVTPTRQPSPVLVPVDPAKAGACVIVKDKKFAAWINPTQPKCIVGGMQKHEEKHIADFKADPKYKDIPKSGTVPDGETFYYKSAADAKRFEHPAIDIEIAWINKQLKPGILARLFKGKRKPKPKDQRILEHRAKVTLPAYKASFG
ncbi:MAG: hypothetical protein HWN51_05155, partial [Desulfobacterales bacterium]|nr:hypothetical protein [Desulfobacterales bacterium]